MKPGLQHKQMLAVRAAIQGDDAALQQIRRSRNQAPVLPQGVNTSYPQSNLCLFTPTVPSERPRPLLLYLHGGGWCFGSINSCSRFCAALALEANCCVAALDYSLAPASPFPAPLADCRRLSPTFVLMLPSGDAILPASLWGVTARAETWLLLQPSPCLV